MSALGARRRSRGTDRLRRGRVEAARDREVLEWIGRFRFVTAAVLAERFAVSTRQMNARLARLVHDGLVVLHREHVDQARAVYLSRTGSAVLGHRPRRVPRPDVHRRHELAIAQLVAWLEDPRQPRAYTVLTERECHRREADG